jgi:glycosyltransferase involved in cell wall biosynthesis
VIALGSGTFILLATHNGERFLAEQIESLLAQTATGWTLLARDDRSTDRTTAILEGFARRDSRIQVLPASAVPLNSAGRNFAGLLQAALERSADYVFCCDQDDVWAVDKLERMLSELRQAEGSGRRPCLVHHDLAVVDEQLKTVNPSYWSFMALRPGTEVGSQRLLSRNEVTGCAIGCNRALLELALPMPEAAIMHDWWLALFAGFCGRLVPVRERLVSYRQHGSNVIGARSYKAGLNPLQNWLVAWRSGNAEFLETVRQARAFRVAAGRAAGVDSALGSALDSYCELPRLGRMQRISALRASAAWRHNWLLDSVLVLRVLLLARERG